MKPRYANVRIITAVNVKPEDAVKSGHLRQDLYYRLNTITLNLPPLRERSGDLQMLVRHFIRKYNNKLYKNVTGASDEVMKLLKRYDWPGNVRELEHVIEGAISVMDSDLIEVNDLPIKLRDLYNVEDVQVPHSLGSQVYSLKESMERAEKYAIEQALESSGGNVTKAAKLLSVPRQTLQYKLKKHKIVV